MAVETATYINQLNPLNPAETDGLGEGDNHIRLSKQVLLNTFPNIGGPITSTHTQLNNVILTTTAAADKLPYFNGTTTATTCDFTSVGRSILGAATGTAALQAMGADTRYPQINVTNTGGIGFSNAITTSSYVLATGNYMRIEGTTPQLQLYDTNWGLRSVYADGGLVGFLSSGGNWTFYSDNSGNTYQTGTAQAYDFTLNSDPTLKEDIKEISAEAARTFVATVKGYTYKFVNQDTPTAGVLSTEVATASPSLVSKDDNDKDRVSYLAIIPYLLTDLEAAHKRIADLEGKLAFVDQLQNRLDVLEHKVG